MKWVYYSFRKGFLYVCEGLLGSLFSYPIQVFLLGTLEDVLNWRGGIH